MQKSLPTLSLACQSPECPHNECSTYICKQADCFEKQQNFLCTICAYTTHKEHSMEPLKVLLHKIEQDQKQNNNNLILFAKIDVLQNRLYEACDSIADADLKKNIRDALGHYGRNILSKVKCMDFGILNNTNSEGSEQNLNKNTVTSKQYYSLLGQYIKKYQDDGIDDNKQHKDSNYTRLLKRQIQEITETVNIFCDQVKKGEIDESTSEMFIQSESSSKRFRFSSKLKHSNLNPLQDSIIKMSDQYVNYNYYILCEPKLSLSRPQSINLQMINLSSYVTIGICNLDKIPKNFEFNTGETSHGSYQISFDGYSWGDNNSAVNSQYTGWYFNQGDKVTMEFNPKNKKLKFYKNGSPQQGYELPIEFEKKDKMYFCVTMNSSPEEVHIVNN